MSMEFVSISGGDGIGAIPERAFIVAKNAYATKATYGMVVQWHYDIEADFTTTGNGYDFVPVDGEDVSIVNNEGLAIGLVWPKLGIPAGGWGRILAYGEHPAALIDSQGTGVTEDFYDDAEKTGAEMAVTVLKAFGHFDSTASYIGYLGCFTVSGAEDAVTYGSTHGGYAVPIANPAAGIATQGTARVFCKFLG